MGSSLAEAERGGPERSKLVSAAQLLGNIFPFVEAPSHCNCETRNFLNAMLVTGPHSQDRGSGDE